jgi:Carboxypeptidase regulatory-like domain
MDRLNQGESRNRCYTFSKMQKRDKTIAAAWIGFAGLIIATIITGMFGSAWWRPVSTPSQPQVIAGTVVDQVSNLGIGQATVSLSGRTETAVTVDNGNFRIELRPLPSDDQRIRIHVTKDGYRPADETVTPTAENLIITLKKL